MSSLTTAVPAPLPESGGLLGLLLQQCDEVMRAPIEEMSFERVERIINGLSHFDRPDVEAKLDQLLDHLIHRCDTIVKGKKELSPEEGKELEYVAKCLTRFRGSPSKDNAYSPLDWVRASRLSGDRASRASAKLINVVERFSNDPNLDELVIQLLGTMGDVCAVPVLKGILLNGADLQPQLAALALTLIDAPEAVAPFLKLLGPENDMRVAYRVGICQQFENPSAMPMLVRVIRHPDVRHYVIFGIASTVAERGSDCDFAELLNSIDALPDESKLEVIKVIRLKRDTRAIPKLAELLYSENREIQGSAALILAGMDSPRAKAELVKAFGDERFDKTTPAARAVSIALGIEMPESAEPDCRLILSEAVVDSLGIIGSPAADNALFGVLSERGLDPKIKFKAELALIGRRDPRSAPILANWIRSGKPERRNLGCRVITSRDRHEASDEQFIPELVAVLPVEEKGLGQEALGCLSRMEAHEAKDALLHVLDDPGAKRKSLTIISLCEAKEMRIVPKLKALLLSPGTDPELAKYAIRGLGIIGGAEATQILVEALDNPALAKYAAKITSALSFTGCEAGIQKLLLAVDKSSHAVEAFYAINSLLEAPLRPFETPEARHRSVGFLYGEMNRRFSPARFFGPMPEGEPEGLGLFSLPPEVHNMICAHLSAANLHRVASTARRPMSFVKGYFAHREQLSRASESFGGLGM